MNVGYGKFYAKTFTGSMRGAGSHVIAVMGYAIANARPPEGRVELEVGLLSFLIGDSKERIQEALDYLCAPDPRSRTKTNEGRRLIKTGEFEYQLVNWKEHRNGREDEDRKTYFAGKQAEYRRRAAGKALVAANTPNPLPSIAVPADTSRVATVASQPVTRDADDGAVSFGKGAPPAAGNGHCAIGPKMRLLLGEFYKRDAGAHWSHLEERALVDLCGQREDVEAEFREIARYRKLLPKEEKKFFTGRLGTLLEDWTGYLDKARGYVPPAVNGGI